MALSDGSTQVTFSDRVIGNIQLVDGSMAKLYGVEGGVAPAHSRKLYGLVATLCS